MVAVVARHAEKSELFSVGERAHPTNERNKLEKFGLQITGAAISPAIANQNGPHESRRTSKFCEMQINLIASA
jgi:hypothetical protein